MIRGDFQSGLVRDLLPRRLAEVESGGRKEGAYLDRLNTRRVEKSGLWFKTKVVEQLLHDEIHVVKLLAQFQFNADLL